MSTTAHNPRSRYQLDFSTNPLPTYAAAAQAVTPAQLKQLFAKLEEADSTFAADARKGTLAALEAVICFLTANPWGPGGKFSRPLELLVTELRPRPLPEDGHRILPSTGGGAGGVNSRPSDAHVKAAAACALQWLHSYAGLLVKSAAADIAGLLEQHGFSFGSRRADRGGAIRAWRRDYLNPKSRSSLAVYAQAYINAPPHNLIHEAARDICPECNAAVQPSVEACPHCGCEWVQPYNVNRSIILGWLKALVERAGYSAKM